MIDLRTYQDLQAVGQDEKARIAFIEDVIREHKASCCELSSGGCPYCAGFDDESCRPVYEGYGLKVMIDGGFMYFFLDSGYKQVFQIDFCPKCGANLRE